MGHIAGISLGQLSGAEALELVPVIVQDLLDVHRSLGFEGRVFDDEDLDAVPSLLIVETDPAHDGRDDRDRRVVA